MTIVRVVLFWLILALPATAQQLVWSGSVDARGGAIAASGIEPGSRYVIRAWGQMYFGRWWQNGRDLWNDACYEFSAKGYPDPLPVLQNSWSVPVCGGLYQSSHVYVSGEFEAPAGMPLSFWIFDTDYRDNSGWLTVEVYRVNQPVPPRPPPVMPPVSSDLLGIWQGCDGRQVTFTLEDGQYVGRYTALGGLGSYGFTLGEIGYRFTLQPDGSYVGDVEWRGSNFQEWRPDKATVAGDRYRDTGSDGCSREMTRVR